MIIFINFNILTEQLNRFNTVYEEHPTKTRTTQLLSMDNLKLIGVELQKLIQRVRTFSEDISMEFEVDKYTKTALKKDKSLHPQYLHQQRSTTT
jgi:hypothetical protein